MNDKIQRVSFDELEIYATQLSKKGREREANEAMVLRHLISSLRANAERDLVVAEMAKRFDSLEQQFKDENALHSEAYNALLKEFRSLQRQQDELRAEQAVIAAAIDLGINEISAAVNKIENLTSSLQDVTEP